MRRGAFLLLAVALLGVACREDAPPSRWQDHAVLTWAQKLTDPDPWVRAGAADALGRLGSDAADTANLLLDRLRRDESVEVRARCARALGAIGALEAKDDLLEVLRGNEESKVRGAAAAGLVALGASEELLQLLLDALDARPDNDSLQAIANGFAELGSACVPPLRQRLSPAAPNSARRSAALCLGQVGEAARPAVPELIALLEEPDQTLRLAAILALGGIGGPEACRALFATADEQDDPMMTLEILLAGAQSCGFEIEEPAVAD